MRNGAIGEAYPHRKHVTATPEKILTTTTISPSIHDKRCLIFAYGYYEWKEVRKGVKSPTMLK